MTQLTLSAEEIALLGERGYFTRGAFLGPAAALAAQAAAARLVRAGALKRAGVRRGGQHRLDDAVRQDSITWLDEAVEDAALREVQARFEALRQALNEGAYLGLRRTELQLAHYPSTGAVYQRHRDAFPGDDNRRVTAIVYLNAAWEPAHGGALRLYVDPPLDLAPALDQLVVFRSEVVEHEVRPSFADRYAITAWYSAR
ncbi:MAG: 2OG-Fe(II) oxygenase [Myxococcaceae bacterium]|jgi:SM-20-related protein|nr:2OG-Fe(II) oxygenase [Myxococcaceae bacterium]MCA3014115.1 2OG-Fe(II) oxygenase [Myxococcaceae bacterium]